MILKKLILKNFRQYYETQEITFSTESDRNITVIHGENGSGKTALLNAFNWVLYGVTDLPGEKNLINQYAIKEKDGQDKVEMFVELHFTSREIDYILKRKLIMDKNNPGNKGVETTNLHYCKGSEWNALKNPTIQINRMLPEDLRDYFFFDGERIDSLARHEDNNEIKHAIKTIMDLEIIERSIRHTEEAKRDFLHNLSDHSDQATQQLIAEKQEKELQLTDQKESLDQAERNKNHLEKQKEALDERLIKVESVREIQAERTRLEGQQQMLNERFKELEAEIDSLISKRGYLALTGKLTMKVNENLSESAADSITVYPDLTSRLINGILEQNRCICGEDLQINERAHSQIESLLKTIAPFNEYASKVKLAEETKLINMGRTNFFESLKKAMKAKKECRQELIDVQNMLEEKSLEISKRDSENAQDIEKKRRMIQEDMEKMIMEIGLSKMKIKELQSEIERLNTQISKQEQVDKEAVLARKRYDLAVKLIEAMEEIHQIREAEVKRTLKDKLVTVYGYFLRKNYQIDLTNEYKLVVRNETGSKVAMSQGERQITSLSFIGAIVDMAREKYKNKEMNSMDEGGIYPLVMDSPFGALDMDHRRRVAAGINKLSDQIIVFVSTTQWQGEVEEEMAQFVGKSYLLEYNDPKSREDIEFEYTEVKEVM